MSSQLTSSIGDAITFGESGLIRSLNPFGLDLSEPGISWTVANCAGFTAQFPAIQQNQLVLSINLTPFTYKEAVTHQQLFIFINGLFVGFHNIYHSSNINIAIPRNLQTIRPVKFSMTLPLAVSPKSLGINGDVRNLGIAISRINYHTKKD